jgi:hypothetical protein
MLRGLLRAGLLVVLLPVFAFLFMAKAIDIGLREGDRAPGSTVSTASRMAAQALSVRRRRPLMPCSAKKASARSRKATTVAARSSARVSAHASWSDRRRARSRKS